MNHFMKKKKENQSIETFAVSSVKLQIRTVVLLSEHSPYLHVVNY